MRQPTYPPHHRGVDPAVLRVSHTERDAVVDRLKTAYTEGRLEKDEFDDRLESALTARTRADLDRLLHDVSELAPRPVAVRTRRPAPPLPAPADITPDERAFAMLSHWLGLVTWIIGPGIIMATKGRQSAFVRAQAIEAMNFQITWALAMLALPIIAILTLGIGALFIAFGPVMLIIGGIVAAFGARMRYPLCLRLIKR
ncbi:MAG TPA: DUF1707 and DUF4870 domain-containing protein [Streptosporangiaceae bacterium]|jgi:uncharacterized Tic20 family protein